MAHGKTLLMRNIRRPAPQWVHQHFVPSVFFKDGPLPMTRADKKAADLQPYVNPARDLKPGRRLRSELQIETAA